MTRYPSGRKSPISLYFAKRSLLRDQSWVCDRGGTVERSVGPPRVPGLRFERRFPKGNQGVLPLGEPESSLGESRAYAGIELPG